MSAPEDLAATAASLAETAASLAATADRLRHIFACAEHLSDMLATARECGRAEGLAAAGPQPRGQRSAASLHALPGGKTARRGSGPRKGGPR